MRRSARRTSNAREKLTESEAAFERLLSGAPPAEPLAENDFLEDLFERSERYLERGPFAGIEDARRFNTKVVGVSFEGRQDSIVGLREGAELELHREPENPYDANAIAVRFGALPLGFLRREIAARIAPKIDNGVRYRAHISALTGGGRAAEGGERNRGINIVVEIDDALLRRQRDREVASARAGWDGNLDGIRAALIGEHQPHETQSVIIERVFAGKRVLGIMGTGRGKSYCFAYTAAAEALSKERKTVVLYPLRALCNDQFEGFTRKLEPLGMRLFRANGAIPANERNDLFAALESGAWDMILATPEFVRYHAARFSGASKIDLLVVDETHHVGKARRRSGYRDIAQTLAAVGDPQVLALSATVDDESFAEIREALRIEEWTIDPTVRTNLHVVDARGVTDKHAYVAKLFGDGARGIIYCNSRKEATEVATKLKEHCRDRVAFYHAGVPTEMRYAIESAFRAGGIDVVVATTAFGEGIDLPDVREVVLYHLNFNFTEFNQQAGRAGRDGAEARIHLLFGPADRRLNEFLLKLDAPTLPMLREIYLGIKRLARNAPLHGSSREIADTLDIDGCRERSIESALRIFEDERLVELGRDDDGPYVRLLPVAGKVELAANERFAEGEAEREAFAEFAEFVLGAEASALERLIDRPLYPERVPLRNVGRD
uniref:DNA 3'-5' helicase n=1 Tax=mine drainage metagenome TaxID=410659 RepID=E6PHL2_9ZZZZ